MAAFIHTPWVSEIFSVVLGLTTDCVSVSEPYFLPVFGRLMFTIQNLELQGSPCLMLHFCMICLSQLPSSNNHQSPPGLLKWKLGTDINTNFWRSWYWPCSEDRPASLTNPSVQSPHSANSFLKNSMPANWKSKSNSSWNSTSNSSSPVQFTSQSVSQVVQLTVHAHLCTLFRQLIVET